MKFTIVRNTNGTRDLFPEEQHLAKSRWIESYTYIDLSETEVKKIRDATPEKVQEILKELY